MLTSWMVVAGTLGCLARWQIEDLTSRRHPSWRSWATMAVNVVGAVIAGFVIHLVSQHQTVGTDVYSGRHFRGSTIYAVMVTGFCGGFTTFSSALALPFLEWRSNRLRAVFILVLTPVFGLLGYCLGAVASRIF